jgi:lipid II:glycine glycyltransferase (peptidoglycan interpeptide bridge formation enzyme)
MIAAEILFLGENKQRDKKRFISKETAELLGSDAKKRETISREMDLAYELRNNIMHGNKNGLEVTIQEIEELDSSDNDSTFKRETFTFRIQEYIRCSILRKLYNI